MARKIGANRDGIRGVGWMKIRARHLGKSYNRRVVFEGLSFEHGGGVMGIAGSNGSGKSTLVQILCGLMKPTSGTVEWIREARVAENAAHTGEQVLGREDLTSLVGFVAPYMEYYEELTARENVEFLRRLAERSALPTKIGPTDGSRPGEGSKPAAESMPTDESRSAEESRPSARPKQADTLEYLVDLFDASGFLDQPYGSLSTGQRQRIKMIAAGVHEPVFYCLDEAAANLDEQGWQQLGVWLEYLRSRSTTIFLASNDARELDWCDRIFTLDGSGSHQPE